MKTNILSLVLLSLLIIIAGALDEPLELRASRGGYRAPTRYRTVVTHKTTRVYRPPSYSSHHVYIAPTPVVVGYYHDYGYYNYGYYGGHHHHTTMSPLSTIFFCCIIICLIAVIVAAGGCED